MTPSQSFFVIQTVASIGEQYGGPSRTVTNLCAAIARSGGGVDLVAGYDAESNTRLIVSDPALVSLHLVWARRVAGVRLYPGFCRQIQTLAAEALSARTSSLVHDHGIWGLTNIAAAQAVI